MLFLCILILSTAVFAEEAKKDEKAPEAKWYDAVEFSGFVDVYFNYTFNNRQGGTADTSGTFHTYNKQFAVNQVKLAIEKVADKQSPWGFRIDLQNGQNLGYQERPFQTTNVLNNMNMLQQGYVSMYFNVLNGLIFDAGKMATHIGYEVLDSKDNFNYTIGYIFFNTIPFINTGARAILTINDKFSAGLYFYNSGQGTGYTGGAGNSGQQFGVVGVTPYGGTSTTTPAGTFTNTTQHQYVDGPNFARAYGTQLKGDLNDKFGFVWNTLYADDNLRGAQSKEEQLTQNILDANTIGYTIPNNSSKFKQDYWFVNNVILNIHPTKKFTMVLDWTFGQRSGETNNSAFGYLPSGPTVDVAMTPVQGVNGNFVIPANKRNYKRIYNTYGIWIKYDINDKYALAARFEAIDDSRYGGALAVNPPMFAQTPRDRYDLQFQDARGLRAASSLGQARSFTLTPIINWTENLQIKVDLRRDWALGEVYIDPAGRPSKYQNGIIVGAVAKF